MALDIDLVTLANCVANSIHIYNPTVVAKEDLVQLAWLSLNKDSASARRRGVELSKRLMILKAKAACLKAIKQNANEPLETDVEERSPSSNLADNNLDVAIALGILSPKERDILKLHFGLGCRQHTLEEIGDMMGVTLQRINAIEKEAIEKIRKALGVAMGEQVGGRMD